MSADAKAGATQPREPASGFAFAIGAYGLWGFMPLYVKLADHIPPAELVAHRIIWSVPVAGLVLIALRRTADLRAPSSRPARWPWPGSPPV